MRINDPKTAPFVPILVELNWVEEMNDDVRNVKIVGYDRSADLATEFSGQLINVEVKNRSLDENDREWLKAIGARKGD